MAMPDGDIDVKRMVQRSTHHWKRRKFLLSHDGARCPGCKRGVITIRQRRAQCSACSSQFCAQNDTEKQDMDDVLLREIRDGWQGWD